MSQLKLSLGFVKICKLALPDWAGLGWAGWAGLAGALGKVCTARNRAVCRHRAATAPGEPRRGSWALHRHCGTVFLVIWV